MGIFDMTSDFLIEYDSVGFQNTGNHIHIILREKGNDFEAEILRSIISPVSNRTTESIFI